MLPLLITAVLLLQYLQAEPLIQKSTFDLEDKETKETVNLLKRFVKEKELNINNSNNISDGKIINESNKEHNPLEAASRLQVSNKMSLSKENVSGTSTSKVKRQVPSIKSLQKNNTTETAKKAHKIVVKEAVNSLVLEESSKNTLEGSNLRKKRQIPGMDGSHVVIGTFQAFVRALKGDVGGLSSNATETDQES